MAPRQICIIVVFMLFVVFEKKIQEIQENSHNIPFQKATSEKTFRGQGAPGIHVGTKLSWDPWMSPSSVSKILATRLPTI